RLQRWCAQKMLARKRKYLTGGGIRPQSIRKIAMALRHHHRHQISERVYRRGEVQLFVNTSAQCRACVHDFKHGSSSGWSVSECGPNHDANESGSASIYNRWRRAGYCDRQFDLPRQSPREAARPFADLFDPLQRVVVAAASDRLGRTIRPERVFGDHAEETRPPASNRPQQIGILLLARDDQTAICGYHSPRLTPETPSSPTLPSPP